MELKESDKEKFYFDHYEPDELQNIIDTQHKVIEYLKKKGHKKLYSILVVVDDFADDPRFSRHSKLLHAFYTRGRHNSMSTITSTQKFTALSPIIRVNATQLFIYRLRNYTDLQTFIDEVSALLKDKKTLLEIYSVAAEQPYSFLYVNLLAKTVNNKFYINSEKTIEIS